MDLFPDWGEIGTNVKVWMAIFYLGCIIAAYLVCFKVGKPPAGRLRKIVFAVITVGTGLALFLSIFLIDWGSIF